MIGSARIHRLPQVVADAIAAGEVIERPASVIKELVENALDAGAQRIDVGIAGGGLVRIEVVDDGSGIAADELELAIARHATSKIDSVHDLAVVRTLGFRGEALASIAAVSDLHIVSRTAMAAAGALLHVRCGELVEQTAIACAPGTRVEVGELFATTPARLRFLRSAATEAAAATRVVAYLALTHAHVAMTCRSEQRVTLRSPGGSLSVALRAVFGVRAERELIPIDTAGAIAVSGAISAPQAHRAGRGGLVLVVNGRRVHNRALLVAVDDAYRGLVPSGRHPYGVVVIEAHPGTLDVNVHPGKREVRFSDERAVFSAVQRACWAALRAAPVYSADVIVGANAHPSGASALLAQPSASPTYGLEDAAEPGRAGVEAGVEVMGRRDQPPAAAADLASVAPLRALGQVGGEWMVAAARDAVVLVDPHAAHEKVLYAQLLERWARPAHGDAMSQLLLMPALVESDPGRIERLQRHQRFIAACGFAVEVFGPGLIRCTAVPAGGIADPGDLVAELLDALEDSAPDGPTADASRTHRAAALVACHSAVRFGDHLDPEAQQRLLDGLVRTPGGTTCPHGRPTVVVLDDAGLRRAFRRPAR